MANIQEQKRQKTEEKLLVIPKNPSENKQEDVPLSTPKSEKSIQYESLKMDVGIKPTNNQSFSNYVYNNFFSWVEEPLKIGSEKVAEVIKPLLDTTFRYMKTIDLDKIERDMTDYAKETLKVVITQSNQMKLELEKFLNEKPDPEKPETMIDTVRGYCKYAYDKCCEYVPVITSNVMGVVDYLGVKALGQENYQWARDSIYQATMKILEAFQKAFRSFRGASEEDRLMEERISNIGVLNTEITPEDRKDAKEAIRMLGDISSFAENCFGSQKNDFFSHRITDSENERDGIRNKQPEVVRPELVEDLSRPVFDPFPNYFNRIKDAKENSDKIKYEEITGESFVRVGIDNELSNMDKLKILTSSQKKVA